MWVLWRQGRTRRQPLDITWVYPRTRHVDPTASLDRFQDARRKFARPIALRVARLMDTNNTTTVPSSESKKSKKRKSASSKAAARPTKRSATAAAKKPKRTKSAAKAKAAKIQELSTEERSERIALAAYFLAEQRAFAPNHMLDDWLAAERSL